MRRAAKILAAALTMAGPAAAGLLSTPSQAGDLPKMPEPLEALVLPDKPAGAHWIWIADFQNGDYSRSILYDADAGHLLGMIDIGWEGIKLEFPRQGDEIYNLAMYMSRAYRGERTDALTAYDRHTLKPLREVVVPPKGIHGWPDPNHGALSDDDRFMWMQFFTPAASIGVVDLKGNKYIGELETSGCAHVMAAGPRALFTLCGDGSALAIKIGGDGREISRRRYPGFFDADKDPLHGSGVRSGDTWYFVSFHGVVHEIQVEDDGLRFGPVWPVAEKQGAMTWVPGPLMQPLAIHDAHKRLYVLMHPSDLKPKGGGTDFHREAGKEVWSFDLVSKARLKRIALKSAGTTVAVSQDDAPLIYVGSLMQLVVSAYDERSGAEKREIPVATYPTLLQPVR